MIETLRKILFKLLIVILFISFILMILGELMPTGWLSLLATIGIISFMLIVYLYDPRIYYRRLVPLFVCFGAMIYKAFKPIIRHTHSGKYLFRRCYKIKKMAGSYIDCYIDVQDTYDQYSRYDIEG